MVRPGKLADLVVLAEDLLEADDSELHTLTPTMAVLGGEVLHES